MRASDWTRLMAVLAKGDVLLITWFDRLARSTRDLLNLLATIAEKGDRFKSLRATWADTTPAHGRLMLTVLGGWAEFERELIRTRTGEGRERAKAKGVILGRKPKLTGHQRRDAIARRETIREMDKVAIDRVVFLNPTATEKIHGESADREFRIMDLPHHSRRGCG